jgi:hypothetical protein
MCVTNQWLVKTDLYNLYIPLVFTYKIIDLIWEAWIQLDLIQNSKSKYKLNYYIKKSKSGTPIEPDFHIYLCFTLKNILHFQSQSTQLLSCFKIYINPLENKIKHKGDYFFCCCQIRLLFSPFIIWGYFFNQWKQGT